jgi:5-methylcytosine-specific restriction endonuclease McrA
MRRCTRCDRDLPVSDFPPAPRMRSGLSSWCKPCIVDRTRQWRAEHREVLVAKRRAAYPPRTWPQPRECIKCGVAFEAHRPGHLYCGRRCKRRGKVAYDPIRNRAKLAIRRLRPKVLECHGMTCYLCTRPIRDDVGYLHPLALTIDHVVPVSGGGQDSLDNLRPTHRQCNLEKGDRLPHWWEIAA